MKKGISGDPANGVVFDFDFGAILAPFGDPNWSRVGYQNAPRAPKVCTRVGKGLQEASKTPPRRLQDRFWMDFGLIFDRFFSDC